MYKKKIKDATTKIRSTEIQNQKMALENVEQQTQLSLIRDQLNHKFEELRKIQSSLKSRQRGNIFDI